MNENWGRELVELFTMGVGNYTEADVRDASRAFTGWTLSPKLPVFPYARYIWGFKYKPEDHDDDEKSFLGYTGNFNGEDIIDIIVKQPATARFISRHLYNFFVADEPPVPEWQFTPPKDEATVQLMAKTFVETNGEIRQVLRVMFLSDGSKIQIYQSKKPAEMVASAIRLVEGVYRLGDRYILGPYDEDWALQASYMGQDILNPPTVEGWHTGKEWINSGTLVSRVNFVADLMGNTALPGVKKIVDRIRSMGSLIPSQLVEVCLDLMGPLEADPKTKTQLLEHAESAGSLDWDTSDQIVSSTQKITEMLQLIVGTREYQLA